MKDRRSFSPGSMRDVRERILSRVLRVVAVGGIFAYVPSALLSIRERVWVVFVADTFAFAFVICLAAIRRLSFQLKAISLVSLVYILGVLLIVFTGPAGAGHLFIFAFVFLTSLFGSVRSMVLANVVAVLTHVALAVASALHLVPWPQTTDSVIVISANFILVSVVLSVTASYLIRGYSSSATEEKRLREALEVALREIEHRVKNNLQVVSSLVSLRSGSGLDSEQALADIKESLSAISVVHQLLYRRSAFYLVELKTLLESLTQRFQRLNRGVAFSFEWRGDGVEVDGDRAVTIGILVTEIVTNSLKHAFSDKSSGHIFLKADFEATTRELILLIGDNGRGMQEGADEGAGNGRAIIRALTHQLKADLELFTVPSVRYQFHLLVATPATNLASVN